MIPSANTLYDLSVNLFNSEDLSNNKIVTSAVTRPSEFTTKDVSENMTMMLSLPIVSPWS